MGNPRIERTRGGDGRETLCCSKVSKEHNEKGRTLLAALKPKETRGGGPLLAIQTVRKRHTLYTQWWWLLSDVRNDAIKNSVGGNNAKIY